MLGIFAAFKTPTAALTLRAVRANIGCRFVGPTFPCVPLCFQASMLKLRVLTLQRNMYVSVLSATKHKVTHQSIAAHSKK